jgi:hypothetical protein
MALVFTGAVSCLLCGAAASVVTAWVVAAATAHSVPERGRYSVTAAEYAELHLFVQRARLRGGAMVSATPVRDQERAEAMADATLRIDPLRVMPTNGAGHVPPWALASIGDNAATLRPLSESGRASIAVAAYGWPCPCVKFTTLTNTPNGSSVIEGLRYVRSNVQLPYLPIWSGAIVDAIVYGAAVFGLGWAGRTLVRRGRHRAGTCAMCRYDRRGLPEGAKCPECGTVPTQ